MSDTVDEPRMISLDDHPGIPDCLQRLWTPYRMAYVGGEKKPSDSSKGQCPFCRAVQMDDEESLIVHRGKRAYVICNLYPYNPGHLLICTYRHIGLYAEATDEERYEIADLTVQAIEVINRVSSPAGLNIGINQGTAGGAGIAAHLHQHIVPRWEGDANFLPIIGQVKALPQFLAETRTLFAQAWDLFSIGRDDA